MKWSLASTWAVVTVTPTSHLKNIYLYVFCTYNVLLKPLSQATTINFLSVIAMPTYFTHFHWVLISWLCFSKAFVASFSSLDGRVRPRECFEFAKILNDFFGPFFVLLLDDYSGSPSALKKLLHFKTQKTVDFGQQNGRREAEQTKCQFLAIFVVVVIKHYLDLAWTSKL